MDLSGGIFMVLMLGAGLIAGFLMHRSDFCMAGAFRDIFLFNSYKLIRPLVLLVALSAILFELSRLTGLLSYYPFPWFASPSGTNILGGMLFGLGMVLAGGCVVGVLYKLGAGNLLAGVAILGLFAGSALYAEIHSQWMGLSKMLVFPTSAVTLPQLLQISPTIVVLALVLLAGACVFKWYKGGHFRTDSLVDGFIPYWVTACSLAIIGFCVVIVSGGPMGVSTTYAKAMALLESWLVPQHFSELVYFTAPQSLYVIPLDGIERFGNAGPGFDVILMLQLPLILGIVFGSSISAKKLGELSLMWRLPPGQVCMAFAGGIIMALGARLTPGCNVWHLWGGLPLLTMQSLLFVVGILPGAWLGSKILNRILMLQMCRLSRDVSHENI